MKRFAIIGDPVAHSMSPVLFTAAYHGLYPYDRVEGACFETSWERFLQEYDGINVTAPFKEDAFRAVDVRSPEVERIGAVNLVVKAPAADGNGWVTTGYNSDYDGVRLAILEALGNPLPAGLHALVIGCGGAGKAAAAAVLDLGCALTLSNRNLPRAEALARALAPDGDIAVVPAGSLPDALLAADLILYSIPGEMDRLPATDIAAILASDGRERWLLEANYRDPVFAEGILPERCRYISGRRWLLHQAAAGYIRFTGTPPDLAALSAAL